MRLSIPSEIQIIETETESSYGISSEILMEVAGSLSAREIQTAFFPELSRSPVAIVCGPGNNGGDGLVVARHLFNAGYPALHVFIPDDSVKKSELFSIQKKRLEYLGVKISDYREFSQAHTASHFGIIVDALFGVGLTRDLSSPYSDVINTINSSGSIIISLDIPSGLDAETGKIKGVCVNAHQTFTFNTSKPGMMIDQGPSKSGKLRILQVGVPRALIRKHAQKYFMFHDRLARRWLPVRDEKTNKSKQGHAVVIAGSPGFWGAAQLCCEGAYRMGAGYVSLAVNDAVKFKPLTDDVGAEILTISRSDKDIFAKAKAVLVGPGAGTSDEIKEIIENLKKHFKGPVILDADALTVLSQMKDKKCPTNWILTPHSGELSKLLGKPVSEIDNNRIQAVIDGAREFGCFILLKGHRSLISDPSERICIITSGNAALAKAGTGDVLAGFILGLLVQGVEPLQALATGAHVHGRLADEWLRLDRDIASLMPRDLLTMLPEYLSYLKRQ